MVPVVIRMGSPVVVVNNTVLSDTIVLLVSALVEKIYQAQKERDAAMNARLKLAHNEREELLDKLRRTEREHTGYFIYF